MKQKLACAILSAAMLFQGITAYAVQELYSDSVSWTAPSSAGNCIGNMYTQITNNNGVVEIALDNSGMWDFIKGDSTDDVADITTRRTIDGQKIRVNKRYFYNPEYYVPTIYMSVPEQSENAALPLEISFKYMIENPVSLSVYPLTENENWASRWTGAGLYEKMSIGNAPASQTVLGQNSISQSEWHELKMIFIYDSAVTNGGYLKYVSIDNEETDYSTLTAANGLFSDITGADLNGLAFKINPQFTVNNDESNPYMTKLVTTLGTTTLKIKDISLKRGFEDFSISTDFVDGSALGDSGFTITSTSELKEENILKAIKVYDRDFSKYRTEFTTDIVLNADKKSASIVINGLEAGGNYRLEISGMNDAWGAEQSGTITVNFVTAEAETPPDEPDEPEVPTEGEKLLVSWEQAKNPDFWKKKENGKNIFYNAEENYLTFQNNTDGGAADAWRIDNFFEGFEVGAIEVSYDLYVPGSVNEQTNSAGSYHTFFGKLGLDKQNERHFSYLRTDSAASGWLAWNTTKPDGNDNGNDQYFASSWTSRWLPVSFVINPDNKTVSVVCDGSEAVRSYNSIEEAASYFEVVLRRNNASTEPVINAEFRIRNFNIKQTKNFTMKIDGDISKIDGTEPITLEFSYPLNKILKNSDFSIYEIVAGEKKAIENSFSVSQSSDNRTVIVNVENGGLSNGEKQYRIDINSQLYANETIPLANQYVMFTTVKYPDDIDAEISVEDGAVNYTIYGGKDAIKVMAACYDENNALLSVKIADEEKKGSGSRRRIEGSIAYDDTADVKKVEVYMLNAEKEWAIMQVSEVFIVR